MSSTKIASLEAKRTKARSSLAHVEAQLATEHKRLLEEARKASPDYVRIGVKMIRIAVGEESIIESYPEIYQTEYDVVGRSTTISWTPSNTKNDMLPPVECGALEVCAKGVSVSKDSIRCSVRWYETGESVYVRLDDEWNLRFDYSANVLTLTGAVHEKEGEADDDDDE